MHVPINVKSPNNISKWQMGFNSAFKGLISHPNTFFLLNISNIILRVDKSLITFRFLIKLVRSNFNCNKNDKTSHCFL
jgi:hypothetical protein